MRYERVERSVDFPSADEREAHVGTQLPSWSRRPQVCAAAILSNPQLRTDQRRQERPIGSARIVDWKTARD